MGRKKGSIPWNKGLKGYTTCGKGKVLGKEHKRKISKSLIGIIFTKEHVKNISIAAKNKPPMKENTKEKLSVRMRKELNPNWVDGTSYEPYSLDFNKQLKEKIRERDNYTCAICNKHQNILKRKLAVHHIDYIKINTFNKNLISLCISCHIKTNNNREHWKSYFESYMKDKYGYELNITQKTMVQMAVGGEI